MISKLRVANFKAVKQLELNLGAINVLVGANNSGKTSVIHAVQFAVSSAQSAQINSRAKWKGDDYDTTLGPEQLLWSPTDNAFDLAHNSSLTRTKPIKVEIETDDGKTCIVELARGKNRNLTIGLKGVDLGKTIQSLDYPFSVYVPGLAGIAKTERYLSPGLVRRMVAQGDANMAFRNVLLQLKADDAKWATFQDRFHDLFPTYGISVFFDQNYDEYINVITRHGSDERPIDTAGTGMLQVIQVLAYAGLYEPTILLLDEPDAHLHPNNQRLLCTVIRKIADELDTQVVISTHSQHIMEDLQSVSEIHWIQGGESVHHLDQSRIPILADLGALGLQDRLISGQTRCLVATEDAEKGALKILLEASGFNMEETRVESYSGCSNIVAARVLAEFVKSIAPSVHVVIHRDRDGMSSGEMNEFVSKLNEEGIKAFVTKGNDVESYFVGIDHICGMYPDLERMEAERIHSEVLQELKSDSIKRLVNIRSDRNFKRDQKVRKDAGSISMEAHTDYDAEPFVYVNSKKFVTLMSGKLQAHLGKNVKLIDLSEHIKDAELEQLVLEMWPVSA